MRETRLVSVASDPGWVALSIQMAEPCHPLSSHAARELLTHGLQVGPSDKTDIQSTTLLKTIKWTRCLCPPDPKARL